MPIALGEQVRLQSIEALNQLLADTMSLRDMYKKHHWQVSGPTFYQLHLLFDAHYKEQSELVDTIAERIMSLGGVSVAMAHDVAEMTMIRRPPKGRENPAMQLTRLVEAHRHILASSRHAAKAAAEAGDDGTNDLFVSDVIRQNEMQTWFLAEHLVSRALNKLVSGWPCPKGGGPAPRRLLVGWVQAISPSRHESYRLRRPLAGGGLCGGAADAEGRLRAALCGILCQPCLEQLRAVFQLCQHRCHGDACILANIRIALAKAPHIAHGSLAPTPIPPVVLGRAGKEQADHEDPKSEPQQKQHLRYSRTYSGCIVRRAHEQREKAPGRLTALTTFIHKFDIDPFFDPGYVLYGFTQYLLHHTFFFRLMPVHSLFKL